MLCSIELTNHDHAETFRLEFCLGLDFSARANSRILYPFSLWASHLQIYTIPNVIWGGRNMIPLSRIVLRVFLARPDRTIMAGVWNPLLMCACFVSLSTFLGDARRGRTFHML